MGNSGKWFRMIEAFLAVMVIIMGFIMLREKNREDFRKISVIIQNSEDMQWAAFRYGLKMAAQDQEIELAIASTGDLLTAEDQLEIIRREIDHGADAVIVQPVSEEGMGVQLKKIEKKVPVMLVECMASEEQQPLFPAVEPDHNAMGYALAQELAKDYNGSLSGKKYGIVMEECKSEAIQNRKKGFEKALKDTGAELRWVAFASRQEAEKKSLEYQPEVDFVIALDDYSLITAAECAAANNLHGALVYGIGNSTEAAYYLDTEIVECLVVPDTFSVGYQSLTETAENLKYFFFKMESRKVAYTVLRREELFSKENQELLFTMSQ